MSEKNQSTPPLIREQDAGIGRGGNSNGFNSAESFVSGRATGQVGHPPLISYEVSRRPQNRRVRRFVPAGTALFTPSGGRLPPAWTDVWITTDPDSPIQATGRDSKQRRVYLYSAAQMGRAAAAKFNRLKAFAQVYPALLRKISRDKDRSEEALVLYLIARTGFRIGSEAETLAKVKAFGASTLRCAHVSIKGDRLEFDYIGKKGVRTYKALKDSFLAANLGRRCQGIGDQKIFRTTDDSIRNYLKSIPRAADFTVKDFRTYIAMQIALRKIKTMPHPRTSREFKSSRKVVAETVASELGNTPRIALKSYISPEVFCSWAAGSGLKKPSGQRSSPGALASELMRCVYYDQDVAAREYYDPDPLERHS